jgi:hypothetical protein
MGAAGIGAAIGQNVLLGEAFAQDETASVSSVDITDLRFETARRYRPFDVISDNFVDHSDSFEEETDSAQYTIFPADPPKPPGEWDFGGGRLRITSETPFFGLARTNTAPPLEAPYAAVIVDVRASNGNRVYAGLIRDAENYVMAWYDRATSTAGFDVAVNGTVTTLAETDANLGAPVKFAFVLNSKEITALADEGRGPFQGWKPVANYPNEPTDEYPDPATAPGLTEFVDLRDPAVLAEYGYGFGGSGDSGSIVLGEVEAGYWGRAGVRDPHVVTWADGTPYIKDNKLYLTLTNAGLDFFSTAHWGLYTLDLSDYTSPKALEEVGKLFWIREGKVMGDHAGHIVYDDTTGEFIIGVSTWGDFTYEGVEIYYTRIATQDIETLHDVQVLTGQELVVPTALTTPPTGNWDPHFTRIGAEWYVAYVESPTQGNPWDHHPALAKGPTIEALTTLVDAKEELRQTEGMVIQKVGGEWYVLCSSGRGEVGSESGEEDFEGVPPASYRIYDLEMNLVGTLNAPYPSNIPHPMITPLPVNGDTKWIMLTFNGRMFYEPFLQYGTHGDFYVMNGRPRVEGYEFEPRDPDDPPPA